MCGIAGLVGLGDRHVLARMTSRLRHRGPDDAGIWSWTEERAPFVGLGNRRLAIRDLSAAGHMPMCTDDGRLALTYNGELYNADELRRRLQGRGIRFRSGSDTEVVLRALETYGVDALPMLEGMFALAAVDTTAKRFGRPAGGPALLLARDPLGIKPLYLTRVGDTLAFASEVKALLEVPGFSVSVDAPALSDYLTLLWVPDPDTLFAGVEKLPPAHWALHQDGRWQLERYWRLPVPPAERVPRGSESELVAGLREQIQASVHRQMVSDVPLGAFLSAGLDSSAIVEAMCHRASEPVRTFTVTFPRSHRKGESTLDDPAVAWRTAERLGCQHKEIIVEPDVVDLLPKLVWAMDDPVGDPAILTAYEVCRAASRDVTVLLSGVGGDELFAGYRKYAVTRLRSLYRKLPAWFRQGAIDPTLRSLPGLRGSRLQGMARLGRKFGRSASLPPTEAFLRDSVYTDEVEKDALIVAEWRRAGADSDPFARHREILRQTADADFLDQMLAVDIGTFMLSLNLNYNDKMSMATSVEVRVPLLDLPLVDYAFQQLTPDLKLRGTSRPTTKYALRQALRGHVADEVLDQPKAGFGAPHDHWLTHDLREMVDDLLSVEQIRRRGLFDADEVRSRVDAQRAGRTDLAYPVWQLLTLELWMRTFMDEPPTLPDDGTDDLLARDGQTQEAT